MRAIDIAEEYGYERLKLVSLLNLGACYGELASEDNVLGTEDDRRQYQKLAQRYILAAALFAEEVGDKKRAGIAFGNLATFLSEHEQLDSALHYAKRAIRLGHEFDLQSLLSNTHELMSFLYKARGQRDSSFLHARLAYDFAKQSNSDIQVADISLTLANRYMERGDLERAKALLTQIIGDPEKRSIPRNR